MSLERMLEPGSKPVSLAVKLPERQPLEDPLSEGLRNLYRRGEFTDVVLVCAGLSYPAHRAVLAARSESFRRGLSGGVPPPPKEGVEDPKQEIRFADISNPEAVKFMLDYIYQLDNDEWERYSPRTQEINKDVLRLAQDFELPGLTARATHWLSKDITTGNVVERLKLCEDFSLHVLGERILEQLTCNKTALAEVAGSKQIVNYPRLLRALLQRAVAVPDDTPQPKKPKT